MLHLARFNNKIIYSNTRSCCILHHGTSSIQFQVVICTINRNATATKRNIGISRSNYAISAKYQRAAVKVYVVVCSNVACAASSNATSCYVHIFTCVDIACTACSNSTCVQVNVIVCSNVACAASSNAAGCYVHIFTCSDIACAACSNSTCIQVNAIACSDVACAASSNTTGCYVHIFTCVDIACAACSNSACVQVNIVTVNSYISACVNAAVACVVTEVHITVQVELSISCSSNAVNYQACILRACALQVNRTVFCLSVNHSAVFQNTDTIISFADIAVGCLQVNAFSVQITDILACFRSHLHTVICFEHQRTCCRILNCQHLRRLAACSRLMQIYAVACISISFQIAAEISLDEGILAAYITIAALDNKVIGNNAAVVHANTLITEQLNVLRRVNRTGNIQHSILNACQINITSIFSFTGVGLQIQLAAICQLYSNLTLLTNLNSAVSIIPGKVTGLSLCQKLKIIQIAHILVGNVGCFAVDTDVLACAQADVLALNVGLIYRQYLAGFCIQHAVLNSIQQLIFAPAIGSAVINLCIHLSPVLNVLAVVFAFEGCFAVGFVSFCQCLVFCQSCILRVFSIFLICHSQLLCPVFQCLHTLTLGCRCRCCAFFCLVITVNQSQLLPLLQLAFAVGQGAVAYCVDKAAAGCEIYITSLADNMTDTHIAVAVGQRDIAISIGIYAFRHSIAAGQRLTRSNRCVDCTKAGEINAVAVQNSATSRSNVACCVNYQVTAQRALIAADKLQLAAVGINAYVTSRCFNIQLRHVAQCTVIDADAFGCFSSQVIRVNACATNRADSATNAV